MVLIRLRSPGPLPCSSSGRTSATATPPTTPWGPAACGCAAGFHHPAGAAPERFGFAYGTLPGHPEAGEESFPVDERPDGVYFVIGAFFRMVHSLARLGGAVSHRLQRDFTQRYLDGPAMHVVETVGG